MRSWRGAAIAGLRQERHVYSPTVANTGKRRQERRQSVERHGAGPFPTFYARTLHAPRSTQAAWRKSLEVINETNQLTEQICLFPEDREIPPDVLNGLQVKLSELTLQRPRVFGDCWLGCRLWDELDLGGFWRARLPVGKAQVPWFKVLAGIFDARIINTGLQPGGRASAPATRPGRCGSVTCN